MTRTNTENTTEIVPTEKSESKPRSVSFKPKEKSSMTSFIIDKPSCIFGFVIGSFLLCMFIIGCVVGSYVM